MLSPLRAVHRLSLLVAFAAPLMIGVAGPAAARAAHHAQPCLAGQKTLRTEPLDIATAHGVQHFTVEIADTEMTREIGEMCRTSVPPFGGMLFDFRSPQTVSFWMRNTIIPLDILFIGPDGRVVTIVRNARPLDETPVPAGGVTALGVLELRGGRAAELGIQPGDKVRHRVFPS